MRGRVLAVSLACLVALPGAIALLGEVTADSPGPFGRQQQPVVLLGGQFPALSVVPGYVEVPPLLFTPEEQDGVYLPLPVVPGVGADAGAAVDELAAWRWSPEAGAFEQVPFQVDERFIRYLTNYRSGFGDYSQADMELTYAFDTEGKKREHAGTYCTWSQGSLDALEPLFAFTTCLDQEPEDGYACHGDDPMQSTFCDPGDVTTPDPVPGLDHDDEMVFMALDAGPPAPADRRPAGAVDVYRVDLDDPLDATGTYGTVYVGRVPGGAPATEAYVSYSRDPGSDTFVWAERGSYGGAQGGGPCYDFDGLDPESDPSSPAFDATPTVLEPCEHRRPLDSATVVTDGYTFHYSARWKMDDLRVRDPDTGDLGPDLVDRWKGRAFQLREDVGAGSSIAFEDETYWAHSSILMGVKEGPVRVIREEWGADSGTQTTRTDFHYADRFDQLYHLRVHPIPPDGLYAFWDHNVGAVDTYYSPQAPDGVRIDGRNDEQVMCREPADTPLDCPGDNPGFLLDIPDPTLQNPVGNVVWDQVTGDGGTMITVIQGLTPHAGVLTPYYRDDLDFDDGTGHDPSPSLQKNGCDQTTSACQGSFGAHGVHFFFTGDTDNLMAPVPATEFVADVHHYLGAGRHEDHSTLMATLDVVPLSASVTALDG